MRFRVSILLVIALAISCNQPPEKEKEGKETGMETNGFENQNRTSGEPQNDTLVIVDSELTLDPFGLGTDPLNHLRSRDGFQVGFRTLENRHIENQVDSVFQIQSEADSFEIYKAASDNWLLEAEVNTGNFQTKRGISVGMRKSEVQERLDLDEGPLPDVLRLRALAVPQWLDLKFRNDTLKGIGFKGYVD